MSVMTVDPFEREQTRDAALWTGAALLVAALHVGLAVAYLLLKPAPAGQAEAPVYNVAFMPATGAPAPAAPEALPAEPTPPVERSELAPPQTKPAPPPEPAPPPVALQAPEPAHPDQVTVAPPQAKPEKLPERSEHEPAAHEKAERGKAEREKAEREKHRTAQQRPAAVSGSRPARLAMAPNAGADSEGARAARASWESEVAAHIRRYATYPANGSTASGTVRVGVTIDRNGRLVSRRLAGSSGSPMLDNAAMAVVARAQPFPRFPPGMNQAQIALIIPLHLRPQ